MKRTDRLIGIDLFCGAGGMSLGFELAGFSVEAAVDCDPIHVQTHSINFPRSRTILGDISRLSGNELRRRTALNGAEVDVVFGGPPCQGFSLIGKRRLEDSRNYLLQDFARLVCEIRPKYFAVENVEGLLRGKTMSFVENFMRTIEKAGYEVVEPIRSLDASLFGVPQRRRRVFILGFQKNLRFPEYPLAHGDADVHCPTPTVWDAIGDLPDVDRFDYLLSNDTFVGELRPPSPYASILRNGTRTGDLDGYNTNVVGLTGCLRTVHSAETVRRFSATKPGSYESVSRFYRLTKVGLAPTLRAGTTRNQGSFTAARPIHPMHPRCITVREAARLHSFFDWFEFHPTKWHGFRQVGNAVPPFLCREVAIAIKKVLEGNGGQHDTRSQGY